MTNNSILRGTFAFEAICQRLTGSKTVDSLPRFEEPAYQRLIDALYACQQAGKYRPSPLDIAVLTRQFLRYREFQTNDNSAPIVKIQGGAGWPSETDWKRVNIEAKIIPEGFFIRSLPWRPDWLNDVGLNGVDATCVGETVRQIDDSVPGDPFLARFKRSNYRSRGQKTAMRAALLTPAGHTLLICLPTGDGKSFIFQLISQIGFGDASPGVTLVITPTVALALDHERAAYNLGLPRQRLAYRGGDSSGENNALLKNIANGNQYLCFASPEAVCGSRLRNALTQAAKNGVLRSLVIDEAHLVETWGANFRSEFQLLAGIRRSLLQNMAGPLLRTFLLSATVTEETVTTLKVLFGNGPDGHSSFGVYAAQKLRPEIEYWVAPITENEETRNNRVLEALLNLPRQAILYVTERKSADWWLKKLRETGLNRIAKLTGETPTSERQRVIDAWCRGDIDLVIGTSAFGLGIDNPHVRTIIHACVPETLDRLYQEAGRGGRDGRASISLVIPTQEDKDTAHSLNHPKLITVDVGFERWKCMFEHPDRTYDPISGTHTIRLDVAPGTDAKRIDMVGETSTEWNARTLVLMAGAGMISILGSVELPENSVELGNNTSIENNSNEEFHQKLIVKILETRHLEHSYWEKIIEPQRQRLEKSNRINLQGMSNHLRAKVCSARLFSELYGFSNLALNDGVNISVSMAKTCGGCPYCRHIGREPYQESAPEHSFPWPVPVIQREIGLRFLDDKNRLLIFYSKPFEEWSMSERRRFIDGLALFLKGSDVRNIIAPAECGMDVVSFQEKMPFQPLFFSEDISLPHLPPGPTVLLIPPEVKIPRSLLGAREPDHARFIFLYEKAEDPNNPGLFLKPRHIGKTMTSDQFLSEVEQ